MLVSRTTRTRRAHFLVDHVEELLLVVAGIAVLDAANREVQDLAAYRFVHELRQVALLAAGAGQVRADRTVCPVRNDKVPSRSEEHTSELQSLMRISYAVFCLKKKNNKSTTIHKKTNIRSTIRT